jgi:hypothetical protein
MCPVVFDTPLSTIELLWPDCSTKQTFCSSKHLTIDNISVHRHMSQMMQNSPALKHNIELLSLCSIITVWVGCFTSFQVFVEICLPGVVRASESSPPSVTSTQSLYDTPTQDVNLKISLVHVPRDTQKTCHENGSAKGSSVDVLTA